MGMQVTGKADFIAQYLESGDLYGMIVSIISISAENKETAEKIEAEICKSAEEYLK